MLLGLVAFRAIFIINVIMQVPPIPMIAPSTPPPNPTIPPADIINISGISGVRYLLILISLNGYSILSIMLFVHALSTPNALKNLFSSITLIIPDININTKPSTANATMTSSFNRVNIVSQKVYKADSLPLLLILTLWVGFSKKIRPACED